MPVINKNHFKCQTSEPSFLLLLSMFVCTTFLTMGRKAKNDQNKNEHYRSSMCTHTDRKDFFSLPSMYLHRNRHTARSKNNKADKTEYTGLVYTGM